MSGDRDREAEEPQDEFPDEPEEPADELVRARWVRGHDRAWVKQCDGIMMEYGVVSSARAYEKRKTAKNRVERLRELMVKLGLHEKWQLVTHTERKDNGWGWHLEYVGEHDGRAENRHPAAA